MIASDYTRLRDSIQRDEEWRVIKTFPLYEVSNYGRARLR